MSRPICTSLDSPPADVDGAIVRVRDQNWQQGGENGAPLNAPRFVKSWSLDGGSTWGIPGPGAVTQPDQPVQGQSPAGQMTEYDFRGLIPPGETRTVTFEVAGGTHSHYVREDGTTAYDVIEWGNQFQNGGRVRFSVAVTNPATAPAPTPTPTPPPPANDLVSQAITHLDEAKRLWLASSARKSVVKANPNSYPQTNVGKMESRIDQALYVLHEARGA